LIFQDYARFPHLSVGRNVAFGLKGPREEVRARVEDQLSKVGMLRHIDAFPHQLSGGEQQRVAVARAIVDRPAVLFADEPTGNLDAETGARIIDLLFGLAGADDTGPAGGAALLLVTHDPALAERCDRVVHIRDGVLT
jgi:putative ABC transport system ATP-binding protein